MRRSSTHGLGFDAEGRVSGTELRTGRFQSRRSRQRHRGVAVIPVGYGFPSCPKGLESLKSRTTVAAKFSTIRFMKLTGTGGRRLEDCK